MVESSDEPSLLDRVRPGFHKAKAHASGPRIPTAADDSRPATSLNNLPSPNDGKTITSQNLSNANDVDRVAVAEDGLAEKASRLPPPAPPPLEAGDGKTSSTINPAKKPNIGVRFYHVVKDTLLSSYFNALLIFVPVGIACKAAEVNPTIVFAMNAIAIVPLAGLLVEATESVAAEMGDTIGSLMNVTFGNAVELIIFIALVKNEIRIVQASLLGSILANLLLILGMSFLLGGLRFREQVYNNTVTQMSACLLSLSVMSLLLPTAFHASFTDGSIADAAVLHVSRGTSVILLLVYVLYLLFQLKSHAYLYQSTPQHVIDEESHPGVLAEMLGSSSSSNSSSSSSDSDSDGSSGSQTTAKRLKRVLRGRRRRKSSASSKEAPSLPSTAVRSPSTSTFNHGCDNHELNLMAEAHNDHFASSAQPLGAIASGDEADTDGEHENQSTRGRNATVNSRDFENEKTPVASKHRGPESKQKIKRKERKTKEIHELASAKPSQTAKPEDNIMQNHSSTPHVGFTLPPEDSPKRPFTIRGISMARPAMPAMPRMLSSTVFSAANPTGLPYSEPQGTRLTPRALHRSSSLPSRLNQTQAAPAATTAMPVVPSNAAILSLDSKVDDKPKKKMSRTSAVVMLVISTALVAVCAEFLVDSINYIVDNTNVSEAFIGLIILPIVGNAAEHVCAVTVASKNKMDLAIGVAVGSSIQIALFVTPLIVLLGWILHKDMTLYFTLFETVSLFVTAFVVNFLVLDGRSNYLEGALLIAAYVIIALLAFYYPDSTQQSMVGGAEDVAKMLRLL